MGNLARHSFQSRGKHPNIVQRRQSNNLLVLNSYIRGYHVYKDVWTPVIGEILTCCQEPNNVKDSEAVAVKSDDSSCILRHVPLYLSKWVSHFLKKSTNKATTEVTGTKVNCGVGLEVLCRYKFSRDNFSIEWLTRNVEHEETISKTMFMRKSSRKQKGR